MIKLRQIWPYLFIYLWTEVLRFWESTEHRIYDRFKLTKTWNNYPDARRSLVGFQAHMNTSDSCPFNIETFVLGISIPLSNSINSTLFATSKNETNKNCLQDEGETPSKEYMMITDSVTVLLLLLLLNFMSLLTCHMSNKWIGKTAIYESGVLKNCHIFRPDKQVWKKVFTNLVLYNKSCWQFSGREFYQMDWAAWLKAHFAILNPIVVPTVQSELYRQINWNWTTSTFVCKKFLHVEQILHAYLLTQSRLSCMGVSSCT